VIGTVPAVGLNHNERRQDQNKQSTVLATGAIEHRDHAAGIKIDEAVIAEPPITMETAITLQGPDRAFDVAKQKLEAGGFALCNLPLSETSPLWAEIRNDFDLDLQATAALQNYVVVQQRELKRAQQQGCSYSNGNSASSSKTVTVENGGKDTLCQVGVHDGQKFMQAKTFLLERFLEA